MPGLLTFSRISLSTFIFVAILFLSIQAQAQGYAPPGSYKETCRGIQVRGGILIAQCQKADGSWRNSTLLFHDCEGDIRNDNGELKCKQKVKPSKPVPGGSYKQTCKDARVEGDFLRAKCQKKNGDWNNTKLKYKKCSGDIWNDNGELTCKESGSKKVPGGSYKNSCKDYYVEGKRLYARCQKKSGGWNNSSINYKNCDKDIWNDNGVLTCGNKNGAKLPKGSYKESCRNYYVEGNLLEAECRNKNGKWVHSSIKYKNCNKGVWNDSGKLRCN